MRPEQRSEWIRGALDTAFRAIAEDDELSRTLVYKGARVLALRLGVPHRASYDLDANVVAAFAQRYPTRAAQISRLEELISRAISKYVRTQDPQRFELESVKVIHRPRDEHPLGWNAFDVSVGLRDFSLEGVRGMPTLKFDIAAPEALGRAAVAPLTVGDQVVFAYTLERIAGEKLRAFLSSLPRYREKVGKPGEAIRAKDLYDLASILRVTPKEESGFWSDAGAEFVLACASRYIDCEGIETFAENLEATRSAYESDPTLPKDVSFDQAWAALECVVQLWLSLGLVPMRHPLPAG